MRVVLSRLAELDLDAIWDFVALDSPEAADRVASALEKAFASLAKNPGIGHYREELADRRHRFLSVYSYLIVYRTDVGELSIVRVFHGSRDVRALLETDWGPG